MSSIVLATNRMFAGYFFYFRRPTFVRVGVPINLYTYTIALQACSCVCVCVPCVLIVWEHL